MPARIQVCISLLLWLGVAWAQDSITCERADIGFVVDTSDSVELDLDSLKNFLKQFVNQVNPWIGNGTDEVRIALINYGSSAFVEFRLHDYFSRDEINAEIRDMIAVTGKTDTTSALELLLNDIFIPENGDRGGVPNIGVLITDGQSNIRSESLNKTAQDLKNAGD